MSERVNLAEFLTGFLAEAEEHLGSSRRHLLTLEVHAAKGEAQPKRVRELFRSLHTLKGLAAMIGIDPIVALAHEMETVLRGADGLGGRLELTAVERLIEGLGAIEQRVRALEAGRAVEPAPEALLHALASLEPAGGGRGHAAVKVALAEEIFEKLTESEKEQLALGVASGRTAIQLDFSPSTERAQAGITITSVRARLAEVAETVRVFPRAVPPSPEAPTGLSFVLIALTDHPVEEVATQVGVEGVRALAAQVPEPPLPLSSEPEAELAELAPTGRNTVRVEVSRLDDALEKLSALVVTRFRLARAAAELSAKGADTRELSATLVEASRQLRDLRAAIMRARMVRVSELLERLPLLVRGLSRATGKPVRLEMNAGRAELDKAVGERLFPAIVHLVRNAVDHGLEPGAERDRAGKPLEGRVEVSCTEHNNNQLELRISDDGRGVDAAAVARRAQVAEVADDAALLDLLARPGFSTREVADHTSGRGVGMDVVSRIVRRLGGALELFNRPGEGATFVVRVPLSITIVDAFTFVAGGQPFAIPVGAVEEIVEVHAERLVEGPCPRSEGARGRLFERRGEAVPLFSLVELLRLNGASDGHKALLVRLQGEPFAFAVDKVVGQQEVVVRPLEDPLVRVPGVTGTTDLGDGKPTLVVDLLALGARLSKAPKEVPQ
jgi:two-component system, chemotaxis family, sensor kinase CheA